MKKMKLAVCGTANPHVRLYYGQFATADFIDLKAICDHDEKRLRDAQDFFKAHNMPVKYYTDSNEMLQKHPEIDAVMVGSDNIHHCEHTLAVAEQGKHVFSMKVMSMDENECRTMIKACRQHKVILQIELELHFHPQILNLKKLIESGRLGKVHTMYISNISQSPICYYPNWGVPLLSYGKIMPIRPGEKVCRGGAITDHPHPFDLARWLNGAEFAKVYAVSARNMRDYLEVEDHAAISAEMTNGANVFINPSYAHLEERAVTRRLYWPKSLECMIKAVGTKGTYITDFWNKPHYMLGSGLQSPNRLLLGGGGGCPEFGESRLDSFYLAVTGQRKIESSGEDGLAAVRVMNAAYESIYSNKTVVF